MTMTVKKKKPRDIDFKEFRVEDLTKENVKSLTPEQQRILKLEKRVADVEEQLLACIRFMRYHAEKEANEKDPNFPVHETVKA